MLAHGVFRMPNAPVLDTGFSAVREPARGPDGSPMRPDGLHLPRAVGGNAVIGVWTPSSPAPARFPRRFSRAVAALEEDGFTVRCAARTRCDDGVGAGTPEELAADLHGLLLDPDVDLVMCAVGGYTTVRVLPHLDFDLIRDCGKPVVGYSDVTSLLWAALRCARTVTFHGPMVVSEWGEVGGAWPYTAARFREAVSPWQGPVRLTAPSRWTDEFLLWEVDDVRPRRTRPAAWRTLAPGTAEGWLLPGCAPTASRLFGTPWMPDTQGAILCLETLGTGPEEFLGLLSQWRWSGQLDGIRGLVVGRHCRPTTSPPGDSSAFDRVVREALGRDDIPVMVDVDFGHTEPRLTLPVGVACRLDATEQSLVITEPPVTSGGAP
ncbi:S66 peptidase family protein [Actinacidiphila yeochonensis]|uniref:S66 peptidase family protein n=1 Tax=Actinacidiphila yeochonensis TaxID=89050 RepID=UPI00099B34FA|nr:S66 peptidase family protein [Actinacidiphila yeochonensis]